MAKQKSVEAGVVNIKTHPHSPKTYVKLFNRLKEYQHNARIRGADTGTLGWMAPIVKGKSVRGLYGEFYKFIDIDPNEPWFNKRDRTVIEIDGEIVKEPPVPEHLKPNLKRIFFVFYPKKHRLFFDSKNFSASSAANLLRGLFADERIVEEFGVVDVDIESAFYAIQKILEIPTKTRVDIHINLPNPDDTSEDEQEVLDRLGRINARRVTQKYTSSRQEGLSPDDEMITLMNVAKSNGYVYAEGYDGETKREESTIPYPFIKRDKYNPNVTNEAQAFRRLTENMLGEID